MWERRDDLGAVSQGPVASPPGSDTVRMASGPESQGFVARERTALAALACAAAAAATATASAAAAAALRTNHREEEEEEEEV